MAGFHEKLNDYLIPAALGAVLYFLQSIATQQQVMAQSVAVAVRRLDEYERRIDNLEKRQCTKQWPRQQPD